MQNDGNLVIYRTPEKRSVWATHTSGRSCPGKKHLIYWQKLVQKNQVPTSYIIGIVKATQYDHLRLIRIDNILHR